MQRSGTPRGTNFWFNNFRSSGEQRLIEDLIVESIKIYGHDSFYLPRNVQNQDKIMGADRYSTFDSAYPIELYIKNVEGFEGEGQFLSKFGLEIRKRMTLTIANRIFADEVISQTTLTRPREGDVIYIPMVKSAFEIQFVQHEAIYYQMGALQTYDIVVELFSYNNELFATGVPEIDDTYNKLSNNIYDFALRDEQGNVLTDQEGNVLFRSDKDYVVQELDVFGDNERIQEESDDIVNFSETNPFSERKI